MLSVDDAQKVIVDGVLPLGAEMVALGDITGRVAADDCRAAITQPPFAASAMDGYAARFEDMSVGAIVDVIGEAPAGNPFEGAIHRGQAVRVFTGGVVPVGADHVVIQEDVALNGDGRITIKQEQDRPRNIRAAGIDFAKGDILVRSGTIFHELHGSILATANLSQIPCRRRPRVGIFTNGNELKEPGTELQPGEIVNSNHYGICALIKSWGGVPVYLGCIADDEAALCEVFERADDLDVILPIGGASVGDYDHVKGAFAKARGELVFSKVAVKPGKPTWLGKLNDARVIGLPGNPASAMVTCALFVQPLIRRFLGQDGSSNFMTGTLQRPIEKNGSRETYLRAQINSLKEGRVQLLVFPNQDSSLLSPFAECDALVRRLPHAAAGSVGEEVEFVYLRSPKMHAHLNLP